MNTPLTKEESAFAVERHNLVYAFLNKNRYPEDELYDVAIFGYLRAVRTYLSREDLRVAYEFSTIAFKHMRANVSNHFRAMNAQKRKAEVLSYNEETDAEVYDDRAWETAHRNCASQATRKALSEVLTPRQNNIVYLKADGYTYREISQRCGISMTTVGREVRAAGNAVKSHAPELAALIAA